MEKTTQRLLYADLLRIFATFGVIVIHVGATGWYTKAAYTWDWQIMNMWHSIFRWPVPLFVMISGMFNIEKFDIGQPLKKGIKNIIKKLFHIYCTLFFWTIFYNIFIPIILHYNIKEFLTNPLDFLNLREILYCFYKAIIGNSWFHFWFLYMIIGLYILTPLIKIFIANCRRNYLEYFLAIVFLAVALNFFDTLKDILKDIVFLPHSLYIQIPELSGYVGYYIAGYYFSKYKLPKKVEYIIYILGVLSVFFSIFGTSFISIKKHELNQTLLVATTPHIMIATVAIFLFVKNSLGKANISNITSSIIENISKCSFDIYSIHVFMIVAVNNYLGLYWYTFNPILSVPVICVLVFLLSYIVSLGISKIPVVKNII